MFIGVRRRIPVQVTKTQADRLTTRLRSERSVTRSHISGDVQGTVYDITQQCGGAAEHACGNAAFEIPAEYTPHKIAGTEHADKADDGEEHIVEYLHLLLSYLALVRTNSNILSLNSPAQPLLMGTVMSLSSSISLAVYFLT